MNKLLITFILLSGFTFSQVSADLTIEYQEVVGTDFFFDVYLTRTGANDLYLGNADFVLTFDAGNFDTPELSKEGSSPGFCTFVPTDPSGFNTLFTQDQYFTNTAVASISGNSLIINLNGPTPGDQATFDTRVAKIDDTPSTYRLGRFKVSGIQNLSGFMNLQWVTISTLVYTLEPSPPFTSSSVTINAIDPANAPLPVELSSFTASLNQNNVDLEWQTKTEVNNYGFNVERKINEDEWSTIGFVEGHGNSTSPKNYSYKDDDLFSGGSRFSYRLKQINNDGTFEYSDIIEVEVLPDQYELSQNYPNPFNPNTTIRFSLPEQTRLRINIYSILGELVKTIAEGIYEAGYHKVIFEANDLTSGTYIYRVESSEFVQTRKMLLLK